MASQPRALRWLEEYGPQELERLRRSIAFQPDESDAEKRSTAKERDCALFLLDIEGRVTSSDTGVDRIYGYPHGKLLGEHLSLLYPRNENLSIRLMDELKKSTSEGHVGKEEWHVRRDGSQFWANTITMSLKDANGVLKGFACIARDFSEDHELIEKLRRRRTRTRHLPVDSTITGVAFGEFGQVTEVNNTLLELLGYTRDELRSGLLPWAELTPHEYRPLDELAHEEGLRFGASTPYEKEVICKDETRIPVLATTAVLSISPFRWITFLQDLRDRDREESTQEEAVEVSNNFDEMVGGSAAMKRVMAQVELVAPTDATVLVLGETGTGKELVARAIHRISPRRNFPFISLNCAAIPTGLLESELFGYERGAFTGALSQKIGRFELANRGTLFLDEVGDIPLDLQPKLLRALQEKSFERLGGIKTIPIDVRLVAATNQNLMQMMSDKLFRSDLYYRLKVFPITTPPLRERPDDIPVLARHFTRKYAARMERDVNKIPSETMRALVNWPWPGNVRELENFIERSVILSRGPNLRVPLAELRTSPLASSANSTLAEMERDFILRVFRETGGVVSATATRLGIPRTTLNAMMKKLSISRTDL